MAKSRLLRVAGVLGLLFTTLGCLCPLSAPVEPPPREEAWPSWSPDGQYLVYECYLDGPIDSPSSLDCLVEGGGTCLSFYTSEAADLCISDVTKHDQVRLTNDPGGDWHPVWSPDGSQIAYLRDDGIHLITPEGLTRGRFAPIGFSPALLSWWSESMGSITWSPDGDYLLFSGCLNSRDHDVYVIDVSTGTLTNLTPNSRAHDFAPMWTLDGSKVVFLSTDSSSPLYICRPGEDALPQMKVVNADGSDERIIYDPEFYYPYWQVSVSNSGQIVFVTNMTSRTRGENGWAENWSLYRIDLAGGTPVEVLAAEEDRDGRIALPLWSPNGEYIAYSSYLSDLKVFNVETGEVTKSSEWYSIDGRFVWSPDSRRIAVTAVTLRDRARDAEEHIHIFDTRNGAFQPLVQEQSAP